jgi:Family of unknown function (DUF6152)
LGRCCPFGYIFAMTAQGETAMLVVPRRRLLGAAAILLVGAPAARAHHGWGNYDPDGAAEVTGQVERVTFGNPHGMLWLDAPEKQWEVVLAPPSRMRRRGLEEGMFSAGTEVTVLGFPHRSNENEMRAEWIRVAGTTVQLR